MAKQGIWQVPALALLMVLADCAIAADGELRVADLGNCPLESGAVITDCRVAYRTLGRLDSERGNVIVMPTWYTGTAEHYVQFGYVGPGKMADTDRFFVVAIDAFGNGVSSSPSNSAKQPMDQFPGFTIRDLVVAQHRLLTQHLDFEHVFAIMGVSMGGMQAYQWLTSFPAYMDRVVAVEGTPWPTPHDRLLWQAWLDAGRVYDGSPASLELSSVLLAQLDALTLWSPGYFNSMLADQSLDAFMEGFTPRLSAGSLLDRNAQTRAVLAHDIRKPFTGFAGELPGHVESEVLAVVFRHDHMVNPEPSQALGSLIGAQTVVLDTACGHMGVTTECDQEAVAVEVNRFLSR